MIEIVSLTIYNTLIYIILIFLPTKDDLVVWTLQNVSILVKVHVNKL